VEESEISYTLVTQASFNRIWMLKHHCIRWGLESPISVAVFVTPNDEAAITANIQNDTMRRDMIPLSNDTLAAQIHEQLREMGCNGDLLTVQVVKPDKADIRENSIEMLSDYPVNTLRNLALAAVRTTHVAYLDVDFWPSEDLREILDIDIIRQKFAQDPKAAMVIPAFSMKRQCVEQRDCVELNAPAMPLRRRQMLDAILAKKALQFDPTNAGGHGSTRYAAWINQRSTTLIPIECVRSNRYEPYLVFRYCQDLPPFQEQFTGYGKNKMTWMMQLRRTGWSLWQLGEAFCVHYPHLSSQARRAWKQQPRKLAGMPLPTIPPVDRTETRRSINDAYFVEFKLWMNRTIPDLTRIPKQQPRRLAGMPLPAIPPVDRTETRRGINDAHFVEFKLWMNRTIPDQTRVPNCPDFVDEDRTLWIKHRPLSTTATMNRARLRQKLNPFNRVVPKSK
jgi:hypothetical protein